VIRKLLITYLSLQVAQSIGIDHHAAKEELYYYMRTKDNETHTMLTEFMDHFYEKVRKDEESARINTSWISIFNISTRSYRLIPRTDIGFKTRPQLHVTSRP
jgi:hypothetical protein